MRKKIEKIKDEIKLKPVFFSESTMALPCPQVGGRGEGGERGGGGEGRGGGPPTCVPPKGRSQRPRRSPVKFHHPFKPDQKGLTPQN